MARPVVAANLRIKTMSGCAGMDDRASNVGVLYACQLLYQETQCQRLVFGKISPFISIDGLGYWRRLRGLPESLALTFKLRRSTEAVRELQLGQCITVVSGDKIGASKAAWLDYTKV
jgi:hypothetical protein